MLSKIEVIIEHGFNCYEFKENKIFPTKIMTI